VIAVTTKTALITGTSRTGGIGFAAARQLAEQGYHVILTARDAARTEPLAAQLRHDGYPATALRLDLTEPPSMADAAEHLTQSFRHLDVLINNASDVVDFTALSALDADAVRSALRAPAYSFAKHTLNVLTLVLARALKDTPILVNSVDPGEPPPTPNAATKTLRAPPPTAPAASCGPRHFLTTAPLVASSATASP
jgi:NAD(P)-dependent dehydrogenase (short-subunit alcohol dehydrogenase family)